jgi:hypothetical protein
VTITISCADHRANHRADYDYIKTTINRPERYHPASISGIVGRPLQRSEEHSVKQILGGRVAIKGYSVGDSEISKWKVANVQGEQALHPGHIRASLCRHIKAVEEGRMDPMNMSFGSIRSSQFRVNKDRPLEKSLVFEQPSATVDSLGLLFRDSH